MELIKLINTSRQFIFKGYFASFRGIRQFSISQNKSTTNSLKQTQYNKIIKMESNDQEKKTHVYDPEDELMFQEEENKMKTISKKSITFGNFKMHKKLAQGIKVNLIHPQKSLLILLALGSL